jgi:FAD/FMN-containing dehydrogenase
MTTPGSSWGRYPRAEQQLVPLLDRNAPLPDFEGSALPHGNGRSYGDSCLNPGGTLLHTRGIDRYITFDAATGILECEAGVLLSELLDLVVSQGWFLPVTPGTRLVTVGGAIANDVHGKNHHVAGSFGRHVLALELLRSDGERRLCSACESPEWFAATVGGLGLTGLITRVRLQLRRIHGPWLQVETQRFERLDDFFQLSAESASSEYTVAWVDCLARGPALGRGVFMRADHVSALPPQHPQVATRRAAMPLTPPLSLVNSLTLRAFNTLYFHRAPRQPRQRIRHYESFFYPLDGIADWNRMYGPRGFLQYQCVVPPDNAPMATAELLECIAASRRGSFLVVLKQFGATSSPGLLSFPRPGTTLALDFPNHGERTLQLLSQLDEVVLAAGGALYPAKDARMPPRMFAASFPRLPEFLPYVDPRFSSGLWRRVMDQT